MFNSASKVTINTGNVLNLIDIKKKAGQNVTEELSESIKLTLSEWGSQNKLTKHNGTSEDDAQTSQQYSDYMVVSTSTAAKDTVVNITRPHDDVQNKMNEEERKNLKIGVKIFINDDSTTALTECLENVFLALQTDHIESVILSYNPDIIQKEGLNDTTVTQNYNTKASPISLSSVNHVKIPPTEADDSELDVRKCEAMLPGIKILWGVLEEYVKNGRVAQLGVADVGGGCLRRLHGWARVRPAIAQINLAACCVVPPALHAFCRHNDVQLLTHSDPPVKIPPTEADDSELDVRKCEAMLPGIKILWGVLEEYVKNGRVAQLGVADVGGGCLRRLHGWARVRPAIAQINLAACCVLPPALHAFCRHNDVQLLTHSDPPDLLTVAAIKTLTNAGLGCHNLDWCARYQVHIKCRGVLALKGYVCKATLGNNKNENTRDIIPNGI